MNKTKIVLLMLMVLTVISGGVLIFDKGTGEFIHEPASSITDTLVMDVEGSISSSIGNAFSGSFIIICGIILAVILLVPIIKKNRM